MGEAISVKGLGKRFRRYDPDRPWTLQEVFLRSHRRAKPPEYFWGLRNIGFAVAPGRTLGVVGRNGAGKSTLLRLIGGIGRPDEGSVAVHGRISGLLDLGAGFHPDLTGRENVYVSGVISGLTRREVTERLDSIVAFSELEEFIDTPLRTYSSGMQMRLAFAVAAHTGPDVLLIDEVLAVGDFPFQQKCISRISDFKREGCTIVLVSHDTSLIREMCDEALWLDRGQVAAYGAAGEVVAGYIGRMETLRRTPNEWPAFRTPDGLDLRVRENRFGSLEMEIRNVRMLGPYGAPLTSLDPGDSFSVQIAYAGRSPGYEPVFGVTITDGGGRVCYDTSSDDAGAPDLAMTGDGAVVVQIDALHLEPGSYYLDAGIYRRDWSYAYDYHWRAYP
ncbi:MAG: ABC transporter ATP-binding protein, partial [Acidobacteria bacterium]|nr:ABC transporter ATP-binding protein [Acidobacteriota bacterium]